MKSKINKADSQCHPHKIHNLPLKPFTAVKVKPKHSVFYLLQCLKYEPGSLTRARVRRIPAFLSVALTTYVILLYRFRFVNHFSRNFQYFFGSSPPRFCPVFSTALSYFSHRSVFSQTHIKNPQCLSFRQNNDFSAK